MSASFGILNITTESMESQEVTKIYITCNSLVESKGMYDLSLDLLTSYSMCEVRTSNLGIKYGFVFFFSSLFHFVFRCSSTSLASLSANGSQNILIIEFSNVCVLDLTFRPVESVSVS